ncbi:type VI secretion system protein TssA (plasmid) [Skermanella sp. TT6]|uniref:Type VI secretion system protein TssA n=2 Tax=Skermanella cutis TaxID=2775420 RepID=A0ABX7BH58_9PROT|nr:type VI secretion system protein TssA [Skermanella sp. TT6]QQP93110.1 type VI secretion system protein TssA [Skermanella sp. TT6]
MRSADHAELLEPVDGASPCGEPLDYDPGFLELERATRAGPERQAGDQTVAGDAPDWRRVAELGGELAGRSKDIRIAIALARAWLGTEGFAGLAGGLSLIAGFLDGYWDELHPAPDPDDEGDQTIRLNALANLRDSAGLLAEIRRIPLAAARGVGSFTFNDWQAVRHGNPDGEGPTLAQVEGAFGETGPAALDQASAAIASCLASLAAIEGSIRTRVGPGDAIRLDPLRDLLAQVKSVIDDHRPGRTAEPADAGTGREDDPPRSITGGIAGRSDVIGLLDRICQWYRTNEPSSPVPILLERAKQMVSRDFLELLMELAPDGAPQFRNVAGLRSPGPIEEDEN